LTNTKAVQTILLELYINDRGTFNLELKNEEVRGNTDGVGIDQNTTDVEVRKHRDQMGLGTPVVYAVNDEC